MSMLENSVSAYPKLDGRWACYSGIKFAFDPDQPAGSRVHSVKGMNDEPFDFGRDYNIATKHFISLGRDGYDCFKDPEVSYVRDDEGAALIGSMVLEQMRRFGPSYSKNPIDMAIEYAINPSHVERRKLRMKMLHTNENNKAESGHIKIAPKVEGRIIQAPKPVENSKEEAKAQGK